MAQEVTIDFNENYETLFPGMGTSNGSGATDGDFTSDFTTTAVEGITFTVSASASEAQNKNRIWASNPRLRMYDGTLTIKSEKAFSKIVFTLSTNNALIAKDNKPSSGTLTEPTQKSNSTVTWTGEETTELVITIAGNTQFSKAVVTLGSGTTVTVPTPEITGTTPFTESTMVSISVPDGGSTYYTTDGTTPSKTNGTAYSGPITITETTTVKAISYDEDDNTSEVAEKTFTKEEAPAVETVTLPYEDAKLEKFTKNNVKLPSELTYIWSFDSRYSCMKASAYKSGALESESWLESPIIDLTAATNPVLAFEHAINQFSSVDKAKEEATVWIKEETGEWKQLEGVAYPEKLSWTFISSGDISLNEYKGKKIQIGFKYMSTAEKAGTWEVKEFKVTDGAPVITYTDKTIAEINEMSEEASNINLKLTNAQVVYVDGSNLYVREGDKAVIFYNLGIDLPANSILNGEIKVDYDNYYGIHEIKPISDVTSADGLTITEGEAATPTATTVAELIELKHIADYVVISGVKIVSEEKNYFAVDGENKIQLFKGIDVSSYADNDKTYDIKALFNNIYKGTAEIQPVEVTEAGGETPVETSKAIYYWMEGFEAANEIAFEDGAKIAITGNTTKTISGAKDITVDGTEYKTMKLSNGAQNTLTMPEGCNVVKLTFYSYINKASTAEGLRTSYWKEVAGETYDETTALSCYNDGDFTAPDVREFTLKTPANTVTFTNTGEQLCYVLVVEYTKGGAASVNSIEVEKAKNNIRYNLAGQRVDESYKGVVIMNGKKFVVK